MNSALLQGVKFGDEELRLNTGNGYEGLAHPHIGSAKEAPQSGSVYRRLEGDDLVEWRWT